MKKDGFTLVEMLVVIGITALLSGLAIVYTHVGQDQIALSVEESKIAQLILEAKDLSIATYSSNSNTCAYGVHFDFTSSTYSLFAYNSAVNSSGGRPICPSIASTTAAGAVDTAAIESNNDKYADGSWQVHVAQGVALHRGTAASSTIQDILFYPPDPYTFINLSGQNTFQYPAPTAYIYLSTVDGSAERTITVNSAGQVSL